MSKPTLESLIDEAAKLPPGPEAWEPIFRHYPELTHEELEAKFREAGVRHYREANALQEYRRRRRAARALSGEEE
jgi:hypothetical protein